MAENNGQMDDDTEYFVLNGVKFKCNLLKNSEWVRDEQLDERQRAIYAHERNVSQACS